jgi:hypothetical protein
MHDECPMTTALDDELCPGKALFELVVEAEREHKAAEERRSAPRFPFFRPVWLRTSAGRRHRAFTREISANGAGFIHDFELEQGEVELSIVSRDAFMISVVTEIVWCRCCGDGWYISGGRFIRLGGMS